MGHDDKIHFNLDVLLRLNVSGVSIDIISL